MKRGHTQWWDGELVPKAPDFEELHSVSPTKPHSFGQGQLVVHLARYLDGRGVGHVYLELHCRLGDAERTVWLIDPIERLAWVHSATTPTATVDECGTLTAGNTLPGLAVPMAAVLPPVADTLHSSEA